MVSHSSFNPNSSPELAPHHRTHKSTTIPALLQLNIEKRDIDIFTNSETIPLYHLNHIPQHNYAVYHHQHLLYQDQHQRPITS